LPEKLLTLSLTIKFLAPDVLYPIMKFDCIRNSVCGLYLIT